MSTRGIADAYVMGHLAADAKVERHSSGSTVAKYIVMVNRILRGGKQETVRVYCEHWNAENFAGYLKQGKPVHVTGYLKSWEREVDGKKNTVLYVGVESCIFIDNRRDGNGSEETPIGADEWEELRELRTRVQEVNELNLRLQDDLDSATALLGSATEMIAARPAPSEIGVFPGRKKAVKKAVKKAAAKKALKRG